MRFKPKGFAQRHYDPEHPEAKPNGWVWNLKGVRRVLYQLPEVLTATRDGQSVFLVEGEKDAEALRALGFVATCNPMGAGSWRGEYTATLRGARVIILPDNDSEGQKHAEKVARSLLGVAREVRVVTLPGLPDHGDVWDWLEAGGTAGRLQALVEAASPIELDRMGTEGEIGVFVSDVRREKIRWLWPGRLALGKLTVLDGDPGLGKSTLYLDLAARITTGRACGQAGVFDILKGTHPSGF